MPKLVFSFVLVLLFSGPVAAANLGTLSEEDLFVAGDGLLTRDSATNLEWLDLTETQGDSYLTAQADWAGLGFVAADTDEVATLFTNAGLTPLNVNQTDPGFVADAATFLDLLGITFDNGIEVRSFGYAAPGAGEIQTFVYSPFVVVRPNALPPSARATSPDGFTVVPDPINPQQGTWLVRVVPEPSTALLVSGGLLILGVRRRRGAD